MAAPDGTWLVLARDVSHAIRVRGQSQVAAGLVLDVGTGLIRGVAVAPTDVEALAQACATAVSKPAGTLPPGQPGTVLCGRGLAEIKSLTKQRSPGRARAPNESVTASSIPEQ